MMPHHRQLEARGGGELFQAQQAGFDGAQRHQAADVEIAAQHDPSHRAPAANAPGAGAGARARAFTGRERLLLGDPCSQPTL